MEHMEAREREDAVRPRRQKPSAQFERDRCPRCGGIPFLYAGCRFTYLFCPTCRLTRRSR